MASQPVEDTSATVYTTEYVSFAGDNVRLAGQIDYPDQVKPPEGFPLIFIIQHATCNSRDGYAHITRLGIEMNMAVFRWDKRGTGSSGSGGSGSVAIDTLNAYKTALAQPGINKHRVVILAQLEGSLLLGEAYQNFKDIREPLGVILAGNMLDEKAILKIEAPTHIVVSKNDWNAWKTYAEAAAHAHAKQYGYTPSYYVAPNANRKLKYTHTGTFHRGADKSIKEWLAGTCQIS